MILAKVTLIADILPGKISLIMHNLLITVKGAIVNFYSFVSSD